VVIVGSNSARFELTIVDYQFPKTVDDKMDSNWLQIRIDVDSGTEQWNSIDPCLLTTEVLWLADWLEAAVDQQAPPRMGFIEPNLEFELQHRSDEEVTIRILFSHESRPLRTRYLDKDVFVDLKITRLDAKRAADQLRAELKSFPPRAWEPV
jgi:hypothetical protein